MDLNMTIASFWWLVLGIGLVVVLVVAVLLAAQSALGAQSPWAQLPAIGAYVVIFFLLSQRFVFRPAVSE